MDKWKIVLKYITYSYVLPLRIVSGNITFFFINSKGPRFGYGGNETLVDDKMAYIVNFIVPMSIICLANIFFFSATAYKIRSTPKVKGQDQSKLYFVVCVKLFALTWLSVMDIHVCRKQFCMKKYQFQGPLGPRTL